MAELRARFRSLDRIAAPDVWADVEERSAAAAPEPLAPVGAPLVLLGRLRPQDRTLRLLLVVALIVLALIVVALIGGSTRTPGPPRLVFSSSVAGAGRVYAIDAAGGPAVPIYEGTAYRIHVSPDGSHVIFQGQSDGGLMMSRTDGSARRALKDPGEPVLGRAWESIWAPDSHAAAWLSSRADRQALMIADAEVGDPRSIELALDPDPRLAWAPDSVHLALLGRTACESTTKRITSIVDTETGLVLPLGHDLNAHVGPVWSHHRSRLAGIVAGETETCIRMGRRQLAIWDIASDTIRSIPLDVEVIDLAWSPDDRTIWAISGDLGGPNDLRWIDVETGEMGKIAHLGDGIAAKWARGGTKVAWIELGAGSSDVADLWTIELPNGLPRRIARDIARPGPDGWPKWSPTDEWIAFYRGPWDGLPDGFHGSIWIVRSDGSDEHVLVDARSSVNLFEVDW
jgi:hypothetical protein